MVLVERHERLDQFGGRIDRRATFAAAFATTFTAPLAPARSAATKCGRIFVVCELAIAVAVELAQRRRRV